VVAHSKTTIIAGDTRGWLHRIGLDGATVATTRAHDAAITGLAVAADGTWVTGSEDGAVKRWREHRLIAVTKATDFVTCVAIGATGAVVCAGYDGAIRIANKV
jgi:WD40 repeat protein